MAILADNRNFHSRNNNLDHDLGSENSYHVACIGSIFLGNPW